MGYIDPATIEKIKEAARVEDVIAEFVELKRVGSNLRGYSPFNKENTPSFYVSPAKQIWKDFSSGKGGDAVKFLMEHEKMTYPEALRWLADKYKIEIKETEPDEEQLKAREERESLFVVLEFARKWFIRQLYETDEGRSVGLSYFKNRGFLEKTLKAFDIGYSPRQKDAFFQAAKQAGYPTEILEKAGLVINRNGHVIDRFHERVIFPIHRLSGKVAGFAGRILDSTKKIAKYVNSPETEVYHKSQILYGLYQAKSALVKENLCYLVEGYTDVMAFHQAGITNTVASAGTALTPEQIRLIKRFTSNIVLVYDGDPAGLKAAMRGVDLILENDMNVKVVVLPENEDPDSFARKTSTEDLVAYLENEAKDFIAFKTALLLQDNTDPLKIYDLIRDVLNSIAGIPNEVKRHLYVREIARLAGLEEKILFAELHKIMLRKLKLKHNEIRHAIQDRGLKVVQPKETRIDKKATFEKEFIKTLLLFGNETAEFSVYQFKKDAQGDDVLDENGDFVLEEIKEKRKLAHHLLSELPPDELKILSEKFNSVITKIYDIFRLEGKIQIDKIIPKLTEEEAEWISGILAENDKHPVSERWKEKSPEFLPFTQRLNWLADGLIHDFRLFALMELIRERSKTLKEDLDKEKRDEELNVLQNLHRLKKKFGQILRRVVV